MMAREVQRSGCVFAVDVHFEGILAVQEMTSFLSELSADIREADIDVEWCVGVAQIKWFGLRDKTSEYLAA